MTNMNVSTAASSSISNSANTNGVLTPSNRLNTPVSSCESTSSSFDASNIPPLIRTTSIYPSSMHSSIRKITPASVTLQDSKSVSFGTPIIDTTPKVTKIMDTPVSTSILKPKRLNSKAKITPTNQPVQASIIPPNLKRKRGPNQNTQKKRANLIPILSIDSDDGTEECVPVDSTARKDELPAVSVTVTTAPQKEDHAPVDPTLAEMTKLIRNLAIQKCLQMAIADLMKFLKTP